MDRLLIDHRDKAVDDFIRQWNDSNDYIIAHTSGSTGVPKQIKLLKADMLVSARATCQYFGITEHSHLVMPLSADYIAGKMMIVRAIVSGARLTVIQPSRSMSQLANIDCDIDLLPIVPSQLEGLLSLDITGRIGNIIIGGAPLTHSQEADIKLHKLNAYATYGMTETCSHVALRHIGRDDSFVAMPDIEFTVDNESCLIINAPEYSQRMFITNDIVELVDSTHFRWLGRRDNVINSGGIKIMPETVENQLRPFLPDIEFYITSKPSDVWGEELVMVVATHSQNVSCEAALTEAKATLPHHLIPKSIIYQDSLPHTRTGKLKRQKQI